MKRFLALSSMLVAGVFSQTALAETDISGFVTAGATYGDSEVKSYDGTYDDSTDALTLSRLGIQISAEVNPQVSVTGQLLSKGGDPSGNFNVNADWAFATYKPTNNTSIRAGKIKLTSYLISDYYEVGYAYPWVRPPQEVYSTNPITAIEGIDALIRFNFGNNSLLIQPYAGGNHDTWAVQPQETMRPFADWVAFFMGMGFSQGAAEAMAAAQPAPGSVHYIQFSTKQMGGINIALSNPYFTIRAGHFSTSVYQKEFGVDGDKGAYTSAGITADWKNIVFYSEYFKRDVEGLANAAFPNQKGYYATLGYRFGPTMIHYTRASLADNDNPTTPSVDYPMPGVPLLQRSHTLGVRYELGSGAAFKFDVQQATPGKGTRGLFVSDPNNPALEDPSESVNLYSMAIDVIF
ncbi:MAG: hypothetical protein OEZ10_11985 [Gammaproteobacteria bacterium]|nr:hypothetical protein [Gammaproteobacteria bacterium]